jgi:predicted class III extradiol MEMO1 family dioxygenase
MSISALDQEATNILTVPPATPAEVHNKFQEYIDRTKNTICGRHPIGVLLGVLGTLQRVYGREPQMRWVRYEQSSKCVTVDDSSVSYASAFVTF